MANAIPPVGLLTTSQISSAVKAVVTPQTITPSPIAHANRPSPTHATPEQAIPQGLVSGIPSLSETPQLQPASSFAASTPAPSQTQGLPSQQHLLPEPSSALQGTDLISGQTSISQALPAATATSNSAEAPKIRYALIGVLAGVPALTILGFFITIRWRRSRRVRGLFGNKILPEVPVVGHQKFNSYTKERGGTRISSFFGTSHSGVVRDRDGGFRKVESAPYATSIHSTAGLAGVGAHRGASGNPEPPVIRYINLAEGGPEGEVKKIAVSVSSSSSSNTTTPLLSGRIS
ncbi:hypothetical protein K439DRAFT_185557 [Ramaria rubella]|nr:hypothetical protein K439DRAFT_185557 [Ramaria rubella]